MGAVPLPEGVLRERARLVSSLTLLSRSVTATLPSELPLQICTSKQHGISTHYFQIENEISLQASLIRCRKLRDQSFYGFAVDVCCLQLPAPSNLTASEGVQGDRHHVLGGFADCVCANCICADCMYAE